MKSVTGVIIASSLLIGGCSSRPRNFAPTLAAPAASEAEFQSALATCHQLYVDGKLDSSGRMASAGRGAAVGVGTAAVGGTAAAATAGYAGAAMAAATIVLLPVAILGGAWGMARAKRSKKEKAIKTAMEGCLRERGYEVAGWTKAPKAVVVNDGR